MKHAGINYICPHCRYFNKLNIWRFGTLEKVECINCKQLITPRERIEIVYKEIKNDNSTKSKAINK